MEGCPSPQLVGMVLTRPLTGQGCVGPAFGGSFRGACAAVLGEPGGQHCSPRTLSEVIQNLENEHMVSNCRLASRRVRLPYFPWETGDAPERINGGHLRAVLVVFQGQTLRSAGCHGRAAPPAA